MKMESKFIDSEKLESLPNGEYKIDSKYPVYFEKRDGGIVFQDGTFNTFDEFANTYNSKMVPIELFSDEE
jgi:hypothetical protein